MSQYNINTTCSKDSTSISVTGQVFDTVSHETLPFANVYHSLNSSIGTAADMDGNFTIDIPLGHKLTVSFVGYHSYEFTVTEGFTKVFLTPDDQLDTVVIHGENKKKNNNWLWWLLVGGVVVKAASNASNKKKPALGQPMNVKI